MRAKKRIKKGCAMLLAGALAASSLPAAGTLKVSAAEPEEKEYTADWESVEQVDTAPEWFQDAKFGIYFHWGAFTTPERIDEWYGQHIYNGSGAAYDYHVNTYGDLLDWPYHNFILGAEDRQGNWVQFAPKLTADYEGGSEDGKFDPKAWAKLFKEAGAKFAGPVMEHHDGYSMWDSDVTPWNSVDTGPHLDLAGLFVDAIRDEDMKVLSAMHHAYNVTGGFYGSAWDESPVKNELFRTPRVPDGDRLWLSCGIGYKYKGINIDLAYTYLMFLPPTINNSAKPGTPESDKGRIYGSYEGHAHVISMQVGFVW